MMELRFLAKAENEALARVAVSALLMTVDPTLSQVSEVRTAVSEAVTNAIVHAYPENSQGNVLLRACLHEDRLLIKVEDQGCGIENIQLAMQPFYTSKPEHERTGMGFSLMQSFMDGISVESEPGKGTTVFMTKLLGNDVQDIV